MESVRKIGTTFLLGIMGLGFCIVLMTTGSYALKLIGVSNGAVNWFTQNASVDISWLTNYNSPYKKYQKTYTFLEKYDNFVMNMEVTIEEFCTGAFPQSAFYEMVANGYRQNVLKMNIGAEIGEKTSDEYAEETVSYMKDFSLYLNENNIDFVYVQLPAGVRIQALSNDKMYPAEELEIPDLFSEKMRQSGVDFIDINLIEDTIKSFSLDASGHWMPEDALYTLKIVVEEINDLFKWDFDSELYDTTQYYNAMELKAETYQLIEDEFGYSFKLWIPKISPNYSMNYCETNTLEGDFQQVLLTDILNWDRRVNGKTPIAYHDTWMINNSALVEIENLSETNNSGKKILILGDSFSWPITSYLSQDVGEIAALHPRYFDGDVKKYIEHYQPDLVLWIYQEGQIGVDNDLNFGKVQ